ncbi:MAG TPA: hypothetical protein VJ950_11545 [Acidimicrobiia bacterium]|nr:hypothetical protein [Acidimicrobiia bacterium]
MAEPSVLFYSDNGLGLGHLTRQAAIASQSRGAFRPLFLTMSAGYTLLRKMGLPAEYFPSYGRLGITKRQWEPLLAKRLLETLQLSRAGVVVVDHVSPPMIFHHLRNIAPGVRLVWVRRGLWQPGKNAGSLANNDHFDLVIEPGDLAAPVDQGATVALRHKTIRTEPVVLTDPAAFLSRDHARDHLGLPRSGRAVLINLGDADPTEIARFIDHTAAVIRDAAPDEIHLFAPLHPLHGEEIPRTEGVTMAPIYPIAPDLNAFDAVVSTSGYNSFHEIMGSGLPAVFIPHRGASIDDQRRRAEFAALTGRAHWVPDVFDPSLRTSIERMLRPGEPAIARRTTEILGGLNGAREIADILAELAAESSKSSSTIVGADPDAELKGPGPLWKETGERELVIAVQHNDEQLLDLAEAHLAGAEGSIYLVRDGNPKALYDRGAVFESIMSREEWTSLGRSGYSHYLDARIAGVEERYSTTRTIDPVAAMLPR